MKSTESCRKPPCLGYCSLYVVCSVSIHTRRLAGQAFLCSCDAFHWPVCCQTSDSYANATLILSLQCLFTADAHRDSLWHCYFSACFSHVASKHGHCGASEKLPAHGINLFLYTASKHLRRKIWLPTSPHNPETYFDHLPQKLWHAKRKDYMIMHGKPSNLGPICCYCLLAQVNTVTGPTAWLAGSRLNNKQLQQQVIVVEP